MDENGKNVLHLGADLPADFVSTFRTYCQQSNFKQKAVIRKLVEWWLLLDSEEQTRIYFTDGQKPDAASEHAANAARYTIRTYEGLNSDEVAFSLKLLPTDESLAVGKMLKSLSSERRLGRKVGENVVKHAVADAERPKQGKHRPNSVAG